MALSKIYTRGGDKGMTSLANGEKVPKQSLRIESYGSVDEVNAHLGLLRELLLQEDRENFTDLAASIKMAQNDLHDLGGELAMPREHLKPLKQQILSLKDIERLEREMDEWQGHLKPLRNFILPGGNQATAVAHIARTVTRRAERSLFALADKQDVRPECLKYINRLSDWLFVLGRELAHRLNSEEVLWNQHRRSDAEPQC
jgi:cob(I)alamin adenosyltransferase